MVTTGHSDVCPPGSLLCLHIVMGTPNSLTTLMELVESIDINICKSGSCFQV
jgi:hypothetical protein